MTYYEDLSKYRYFPKQKEQKNALNVGWLDVGRRFPTGNTRKNFLPVLERHYANTINQTRGFHQCPFCPKGEGKIYMNILGKKRLLGSAELVIEGEGGAMYIAPTLIIHYISEHKYKPPEQFENAVFDYEARMEKTKKNSISVIRKIASLLKWNGKQ